MNTVQKALLFFSVLIIAFHSQHADAADNAYQSLTELQTLAEKHVLAEVSHSPGKVHAKAEPLDPRLHLAFCKGKPEIFLPGGASLGSRTTVGARCNNPDSQWSIYIGVHIETETPVLVLSHAVARNTTLSAADVIIDQRQVPGLSSAYLTDVKQLEDYSTRRDLAAGMLLTPSMLQPTVLIHRGQQITVLAEAAGISVKAEAIALSDGAINSRIRVRNINTSKEVEGVVDSSSVVRVAL